MIALILGGAANVWTDLAAAKDLLGDRRHLIVACNFAGIHADHLDAWCSLHTDWLPDWQAQRAGNADYRTFTPDTLPERWPGSSGLYALQAALFEMNATAAILCGIPMDQEAGHFDRSGPWDGVTSYRQAFAAALPEIGGRVRSMGGWTARLYGSPSPEWIAAIDTAKPIGGASQPSPRSEPMFNVTNTTKADKQVWDRSGQLVRIPAGETVAADIDPAQPKYQTGDLTTKPMTAAQAAKANPETPAKTDKA